MSIPTLDKKQREAVTDILVLAMCIDGFFSLSEETKFHEKISDLGWETDSECSHYLSLSTARARDVSESPEKLDQFLIAAAPFIKEQGIGDFVLEKTEKILGSDGFQPEEGKFLTQLKTLLA